MSLKKVNDAWFADFFSGAALDVWRRAIPLEQSEEEVAFLFEALQAAENGKLLDVPCGNGRLSVPLRLMNYQITGVDFCDEFVAEAKRAAATHEIECTFLKGDMRHLAWKEEFDGAFCMGNSFGYFAKEGTLQFLQSVCRSLKKSARFVLDSQMLAESFLVNGAEKEWMQLGELYMLVENKYNCAESFVETSYTFLHDGKQEQRQATHWIYTSGELCRMLKQSGFRVIDLFESTDGEPFTLGSDRILAIAEKE